MTDNKPAQTFILVPGAWLGGWSWHPVARLLAERGYRALALNLPGLSYDGSPAGLRLADAVDYVAGEVERRDLSDVVLVGHSWGGYPATGAAHRLAGRVSKVIYFSAVVPEQGTPMVDENEQYGGIIRQAIAATPEAVVPVGLDAVRGVLMPGVRGPARRRAPGHPRQSHGDADSARRRGRSPALRPLRVRDLEKSSTPSKRPA